MFPVWYGLSLYTSLTVLRGIVVLEKGSEGSQSHQTVMYDPESRGCRETGEG
jgi:hypothetical protein